MTTFTPIPEAHAVLASKTGNYLSAPLYRWNENVFAKVGQWYVRLNRDSTSNRNYRLIEIKGVEVRLDSLGRMVL